MIDRVCKLPVHIVIAICLWLPLFAHSAGTLSNVASATPNHAPTLSGTPATDVTAGSLYSYQPVAADRDRNSLVFTIRNRPVWAYFNHTTGRLFGTPAASDVGRTNNIIITVSDGIAKSATAPFSIRVNPAPVVNSAPTISGTPAAGVTADLSYSFQPIAADSNNDALVFTIQNRPAWAKFDSTTGQLFGTPTAADVGSTSNIVISVSDGLANTALAAFGVRVNAAAPPPRKYHPGHYVQMYRSDGPDQMIAAIKPNVVGMVRYYNWADLETSKYVNGTLVSSYDFSKIQADMDLLAGQGMRLIVQVWDKTFADNLYPVPPYLQDAKYFQPSQNSLGGYTAVRWQPFVMERYKALFAAMGKQFDAQPYFEGVATSETALGFDSATLTANGYTPEKYRDALINVLSGAAQSFPRSRVFWFMNFLVGNQGYIADIANAVAPYGVALGGPDVLPENAALKDQTYPFYTQFQGKMKLFGSMMTNSYREVHTDTTAPTKYWTMDEMFVYARDKLHVNYVFWTKVSVVNPTGSYKWTDAIPVIGANPAFNLN